MKKRNVFEQVEIFLFRTMMIILLVYHFLKYVKFELMHW